MACERGRDRGSEFLSAMGRHEESRRFRQVLEELADDTQFVVITHNRHTVQAADVIYGITMGRDTTSQTISLKLEEVDERYSSN